MFFGKSHLKNLTGDGYIGENGDKKTRYMCNRP